MSDLIPQVGDVWVDNMSELEYIIHRVHKGKVAYSAEICGELCGDASPVDLFVLRSTLIERDGKPYEYKREFEEGAWYPVKIDGEVTACQYDRGTFCLGTLPISLSLDQIRSCDIGDKIEFKGLADR